MAVASYMNEYTQDEQLDRWSELIAYFRWYPDVFCEWITPTDDEGKRIGITLGADQKLLLRAMCRFAYNYLVLPRGYGKTLLEILAVYILAILYPESTWSMSAQTLEASAGFFSDKHADIVRFYPIIGQEIDKCRITDNFVEIRFKSGSVITNMTNNGTAKGMRRNGCTFEECALMDFTKYQDNTEPITSEPYKSVLKYMSTVDPYARNKQTFVTTAYYKNDAYEFCKQMVIDKANCKESFVFGASYILPAKFKRNRDIEEVEALIDKVGELMFNFNYRSRWAVSNGQCIVDIDKLKELQTLARPEMKGTKEGEYYIGVDVARSAKTSNNASAIVVVRVRRDAKERVRELQAVNVVKLPNGLNFKQQTVICKQMCALYNAKAIVIDINGLGKGLLDYMLDRNILDDGTELEPYDMINTDYRSDYREAKKLVYGIEAQKNNSEMITNFINVVEGSILRILEHFDVNKALDIPDEDFMVSDVLPFLRTENFISEVQNITVETIPGTGKLKIGQVVRADKDIYSAMIQVCWYVMTFCNDVLPDEDEDFASFFSGFISQPKIKR